MSAEVPEGPSWGTRAELSTTLMSPPPTDGLGSILVAGASSGRVWEFRDSSDDASAWGIMLESREVMEKKPAEAAVGARSPQDDPPTKARHTRAFLSFTTSDCRAAGEGIGFLGNKGGVSA